MDPDYNILEDSTYKHYKGLLNSCDADLRTLKSIRNTFSTQMSANLAFMQALNPPHPDYHLVAYENAIDDGIAILDQEIAFLEAKREDIQRDAHEWYSMAIGEVDSSEEIEMMKEAAKANNRRSKRSRYRPDSGTNYALNA